MKKQCCVIGPKICFDCTYAQIARSNREIAELKEKAMAVVAAFEGIAVPVNQQHLVRELHEVASK